MATKTLLSQDEAVAILKDNHKRSGLSFKDFAESLGVSKQYLRNVMKKIQLPGPRVGFVKVVGFKFEQVRGKR